MTTATEAKVLDGVCPMEPMIVFCAPKPAQMVSMVNIAVGSGLFSLDRVPIHDGDSVELVSSRVLKTCQQTMLAAEGTP